MSTGMGEWQPPVHEGQVPGGPLFSEPMRVETVRANGADVWELGLAGTRTERYRRVTLTREDSFSTKPRGPR